MVVGHQATQQITQTPINNLGLAISLRMERARQLELGAHFGPKSFPKVTNKTHVPIENDGSRNTM
jgi:hypothetical protein